MPNNLSSGDHKRLPAGERSDLDVRVLRARVIDPMLNTVLDSVVKPFGIYHIALPPEEILQQLGDDWPYKRVERRAWLMRIGKLTFYIQPWPMDDYLMTKKQRARLGERDGTRLSVLTPREGMTWDGRETNAYMYTTALRRELMQKNDNDESISEQLVEVDEDWDAAERG